MFFLLLPSEHPNISTDSCKVGTTTSNYEMYTDPTVKKEKEQSQTSSALSKSQVARSCPSLNISFGSKASPSEGVHGSPGTSMPCTWRNTRTHRVVAGRPSESMRVRKPGPIIAGVEFDAVAGLDVAVEAADGCGAA